MTWSVPPPSMHFLSREGSPSIVVCGCAFTWGGGFRPRVALFSLLPSLREKERDTGTAAIGSYMMKTIRTVYLARGGREKGDPKLLMRDVCEGTMKGGKILVFLQRRAHIIIRMSKSRQTRRALYSSCRQRGRTKRGRKREAAQGLSVNLHFASSGVFN